MVILNYKKNFTNYPHRHLNKNHDHCYWKKNKLSTLIKIQSLGSMSNISNKSCLQIMYKGYKIIHQGQQVV